MKYISFFAILFCACVFVMCKFDEVEPVAAPAVETGFIDSFTTPLTVTSEVLGLGDGIIEHGHIIDKQDPSLTNFNDLNRTRRSTLTRLDDYTDTLTFSEADETYYIAAYIIDVYERSFIDLENMKTYHTKPEDVVAVDADFTTTAPNKKCTAPCTITFTNISTPNDGSLQFIWDFGDGDTVHVPDARSMDFEFKTPSANPYVVRLIAYNNTGGRDTAECPITVEGETFEEPISQSFEAREVLFHPNGGYLVGGDTKESGAELFIVHINESGDVIMPIGGPYSNSADNRFGDMLINGSKLFLSGTWKTGNSDDNMFLKEIGIGDGSEKGTTDIGVSGVNERASCAMLSNDGHMIVCGSYKELTGQLEKDIYFIRYGPTLANELEENIDLPEEEQIFDILDAHNNSPSDYFGVGDIIDSSGKQIPTLFRINEDATTTTIPLLTQGYSAGQGKGIVLNNVKKYFICGWKYNIGSSDPDILLVESQLNGMSFVTHDFDMPDTSVFAEDIVALTDGNVVIVGQKEERAYIAKLNIDSDIIEWDVSYGSSSAIFYSVKQTPDGGYIAVGRNAGQAFVVKTNSKGEQ